MKFILSSFLIFGIYIGALAQKATSSDQEQIKSVLMQYNKAVQNLDVSNTEKLFTEDSQLFESGGVEGSYAHYKEHHLVPELMEFKSFVYDNYKVKIDVDGKYGFARETYDYVITVKKDDQVVKRKGVATSVLKKINGKWKIMISHNSSRK